MLSREKNEFGYISLNRTLLEQIIEHNLKKNSENAWLANYKGPGSDPVIMFRGFEGIAEKVVRVNEGKIYIRLYLVVRFGQSISTICENMIRAIRDDILKMLEMSCDNIEDIQIVVTGVLAKKIAQRNIEFSLSQLIEEGKE